MTNVPRLNKKTTAIVVIDKQNAYFSRDAVNRRNRNLPENSDEILHSIDLFIDKCRSMGLKTYWTQMVEDVHESPENIAEIMMLDDEKVESRTDSADFLIAGRTKPMPGDLIFTKRYYDAFAQTNLDEQLKNDGIKTIVLVGGYASRCVLGTAYGANGHDYRSVVIRDLVINQISNIDEIPAFYRVIEAILGYTASEDEFFAQLYA
ncbi:MAG: biuret amidohydrolase [Patescibacteria group bacterium]|jgi:nicotinamidase-related amidase|nr:biuret amidohydrolase [Patescibacteria group bacterium]